MRRPSPPTHHVALLGRRERRRDVLRCLPGVRLLPYCSIVLTLPSKLVDDIVYEVNCKTIVVKPGADINIGTYHPPDPSPCSPPHRRQSLLRGPGRGPRGRCQASKRRGPLIPPSVKPVRQESLPHLYQGTSLRFPPPISPSSLSNRRDI
jgi:hypothetical protein